MKAIWHGKVIAQSDKVDEIEGNIYFPLESLHREFFIRSATHSICPWKGKAHYFHILVDGQLNEDAAWYYPEPAVFAQMLKNKVTFWKGVEVKSTAKVIRDLFSKLQTNF